MMPYYVWRGVDITGSDRTGQTYAPTRTDLEQLLIADDVGLMRARPVRHWPWARRVSGTEKVAMFLQMSSLLQSGMQLSHVLALLAEQATHLRTKEMLHDLHASILAGHSLADAMQTHADFSDVECALIAAGAHAGNMQTTLRMVAVHAQQTNELRRRIKSALFMPAVTFCGFMVVTLGIMIGVVPQFASMFAATQRPVPYATQVVLRVSDFVTSVHMMWVIVFIAFLVVLVRYVIKNNRQMFEQIFMRVPVIGQLRAAHGIVHFLRALGVLLNADVPAVTALSCAAHTVGDGAIRRSLDSVTDQVRQGRSLPAALRRCDLPLFAPHVVAAIGVGHEAGQLGPVVSQVADLVNDRLVRQLRMLTNIIQPLLLVVLGLLIASMIVAIYVPIFDLSNMISCS